MARSGWAGRTEFVHGRAHLVQLLGADVRAIRETKVDEIPFSEQVLVREGLVLVRAETERPADMRSSDLLVGELFLCLAGEQ